MALHAWCDHVVHVELVSSDPEISRLTADALRQQFASLDADVSGEAGHLEIRSEARQPLTAERVARALAAAAVRTHATYGRDEWSVAEL